MRLWLALLSVTGPLLAVPAAAMADSAQFAIAAQPMPAALKAFAQQAHMQLLYEYGVVANITGNAISGDLDKRIALEALLRHTGLEAVYVSDSAATIRPGKRAEGAGNQGVVASDGVAASAAKATDAHAGQEETSTAGEAGRSFWNRFRLAQLAEGHNAPPASIENTATADPQRATLAEVVVTAQKREERLQDVPVPVTEINAAALATSHQLRIQDFYATVPGLSDSPGNQSTQLLSIRGITTGGVTNPTVGVTVDDVPYGASTNVGGGLIMPDIDPSDLARIEVLRGPQGTLYGASSMGGLLKFVTADPSTYGFAGHVETGLDAARNGARAGYSFRGSVNVPLSDSFAVRASAFTHLDPGYIDNPVTSADGVNEQRVSGGHMSALWKPLDALSLKLSAMYQDARGNGSNIVEYPTAGFPQTAGLGDLQQNDLRGTGGYDRKVQAYSATLKAKAGSAELTSITGYNINQFSDSFDYTYGFGAFAAALLGQPGTAILNYSKTDKLTQELRLSMPLGQRIQWLLGGFYTHEKSVFSENIVAVDPVTAAVAGTLLYVPIPTRYEEYAGFTDLTFRLTDQFDVQLGARESKIRQAFAETESGAFIGPIPIVAPQTDTNATAFTYLATPRYKLTPDVMIYATLMAGTRGAGG